MGRKKGKQSGSHGSKKMNAEYQQKLKDSAFEANRYRNPLSRQIGLGYRNSTYESLWQTGKMDKWSNVFSSSQSVVNHSDSTTSVGNHVSFQRGLAHLHHILEERRLEDRFHDRQLRLALQRLRMTENYNGQDASNNRLHNTLCNDTHGRRDGIVTGQSLQKNPPGWLASLSLNNRWKSNKGIEIVLMTDEFTSMDNNYESSALKSPIKTSEWIQHYGNRDIPSLQLLAGRVLGPALPLYVASYGHIYVGEYLKSVTAEVLLELSISLAKSGWTSFDDNNHTIYAITDGVVKALTHSGAATSLVFRAMPFSHLVNKRVEGDDGDIQSLSDQGLQALCPRLILKEVISDADDIASITDKNCCDDWETLDVEADFSSRIAGCIHLKRLELIDIPLKCQTSLHGGISLGALRTVFQSCPGITHLSLSGCFYNWDDIGSSSSPLASSDTLKEAEDVRFLLSGTKNKLFNRIDHHDVHEFCTGHKCDIVGLDVFLPELEVLDVSFCNWITPIMIFHFLSQYIKIEQKASNSTIYGSSYNDDDWNQGCIMDGNGDVLHSKDKVMTEHMHSKRYTPVSFHFLLAKGCGLSSADIHLIKKWILHSSAGGIRLSDGQL